MTELMDEGEESGILLRIYIRTVDRAVAERCLDIQLELSNPEDAGPILELDIDHADDGMVEERAALAARGVPFYGYHETSGHCAAAAFYSTGDGVSHEWPCSYKFEPYIVVDDSGDIPAHAIEDVRAFLWGEAEAEAIVQGYIDRKS
jgi:hypothetical protein